MPTIYDVAERAGVSIATVSAVLNRTAYVSPELTKRVKLSVEELDYHINYLARSLQKQVTRSVGMLIPDVANPDPFFGEVVRGAEDVLRKKGYVLILGHTYNQVHEQSRYLSAFRSRQVDGVLLFPSPGRDPELRQMVEKKRPLVFVGRVPKDIDVDVVATDILAGTRAGVAHLIQRGHTRIGLIITENTMSVAEFRVAGWAAALREQGLPVEQRFVASVKFSAEAACCAAVKLLELEDSPTAVFVDNLMATTGVLRALREKSLRCPADVEVLSSDDAVWLDVFEPPISTILQPGYAVGCRAAELLLKRIAHPKRAHEVILLKPELRIRVPVTQRAADGANQGASGVGVTPEPLFTNQS
jgi:LacI family transcriptional regulator